MKRLLLLGGLLMSFLQLRAQSLDFANTPYFTASNSSLTASGQTLAAFNYDNAPATHPLLTDGVYFPVVDFQGKNLWVRVRHIAADPNGPTVGQNVPATAGSPFRAGLGGWWGFLYQFDIYADVISTGPASNVLNGFSPTNVTVESLETLSSPELVTFEILNPQSSYWALNSVDFTGANPGSTPGFSAVSLPCPAQLPPPGFSTTFPAASRSVYVVNYIGFPYSEFRMSANRVSNFTYGYEYNSSGGYQGMTMSFGTPSATGLAATAPSLLGYQVFPTVTPAIVTVMYELPRPETVTLYLTDAVGRCRMLCTAAQVAGEHQEMVSLAGEPAGIYSLIIQSIFGTSKTRLVKL